MATVRKVAPLAANDSSNASKIELAKVKDDASEESSINLPTERDAEVKVVGEHEWRRAQTQKELKQRYFKYNEEK